MLSRVLGIMCFVRHVLAWLELAVGERGGRICPRGTWVSTRFGLSITVHPRAGRIAQETGLRIGSTGSIFCKNANGPRDQDGESPMNAADRDLSSRREPLDFRAGWTSTASLRWMVARGRWRTWMVRDALLATDPSRSARVWQGPSPGFQAKSASLRNKSSRFFRDWHPTGTRCLAIARIHLINFPR